MMRSYSMGWAWIALAIAIVLVAVARQYQIPTYERLLWSVTGIVLALVVVAIALSDFLRRR